MKQCCENYVNLMSDYIEGDLSPSEREIFDQHFEGCQNCRDFFRSFKSSLELVTYLKEQPCPAEVKNRLDQIIKMKLSSLQKEG